MAKKQSAYDIVNRGTLEELEAFLEEYPERINDTQVDNSTALIRAAYKGKPKMVQLLINHGADLDHINESKCTALMLAAHFDHYECTELLLAAGADPMILDKDQETAEEIAKTDRIKLLFDLYKDDTPRFKRESKYSVSISQYAPQCGITLTTIYNFQAKTVSYVQRNNKDSAPNVVGFRNVASPSELAEAANFLKEKDGDLCGFKPAAIF